MFETFRVKTEKRFIDITDDVRRVVEKSRVTDGLVNVFVRHTTCKVAILENDILSFVDISDHLERVAPDDGYQHDRVDLREVPADERVNGVSHVRSLYFSTSETIPVIGGSLALGKWQRVCLVELDYGRPFREREIIVMVYGKD